MVTFLITTVLLLGLVAIALYFWQKPANPIQTIELPPPLNTRGLFDYDQTPHELSEETRIHEADRRRILLERASQGDTSVLKEAHELTPPLYNEVLNALVARSESSAQLLALASHVTRHELPVNRNLASALIEAWREDPDRNSTAKMLHLAALADDPEVYRTALDAAVRAWRDGALPDVSAPELQAILEGEFWILSSHARRSGAGFVLKRSLAAVRRELQTTHAKGT
ncbi:MAG: hypothetical protein QOD75_2141 [Blastocatellia bacterium]|jgi:hypothetical protein|nr:hypothetical protein [Blastocatellia bacterium]